MNVNTTDFKSLFLFSYSRRNTFNRKRHLYHGVLTVSRQDSLVTCFVFGKM